MTPFHCEAAEFPSAGNSSTLACLYNNQNKEQPSMVLGPKKYVLVVPDIKDAVMLRTAHVLVRNNFVEVYGGFSSYQGVSAWQDERGRRHLENVVKYEIVDFRRIGSGRFIQFVRSLLDKADEECLYVEIDGVPQIVSNEQ